MTDQRNNVDEKFMQRCLDLAINGLGNTAPNPLVGSVIVKEDKIIGEGFHKKFGEWHAEVMAIQSVVDQDQLRGLICTLILSPVHIMEKRLLVPI